MLRSSVCFGLVLLATSASAQVCSCIDVGDIKRRMKEAQTAIQAYSTEMQKISEQMMRTRDPVAYTPERREKLQGRVQDALNQASDGGISTTPSIAGENPGGTNNLCQITINLHPSATACMRESVKRHEELHQSECKKTFSAGAVLESVRTGKDRFERSGATLVQYAMEEVSGYTTEIQFLQSELMRLEQQCKAKPPPRERRDFTAQPGQPHPGPSGPPYRGWRSGSPRPRCRGWRRRLTSPTPAARAPTSSRWTARRAGRARPTGRCRRRA